MEQKLKEFEERLVKWLQSNPFSEMGKQGIHIGEDAQKLMDGAMRSIIEKFNQKDNDLHSESAPKE